MNRLRLLLLSLFYFATVQAQTNENPIGELSTRLLQNEMLTQRFIRDFVFIKTNTFKKKALLDMDKSLARFDDNMNYFALHLPDGNRELHEDYTKLKSFWNLYRLEITDYENNRYDKLIRKTKQFDKLMNEFLTDLLPLHKDYSKNKKSINTGLLDVENMKAIDNIATSYILKNTHGDGDNFFNIDFDAIRKRLKKIGKNKQISGDAREYLLDLNNMLDIIESTYKKKNYNPKMMFSNVSGFSKKSYKVLNLILQTIK